MIEVQNLHYTYPDCMEALRGVSLTCHRGTITGIVGPNGSGKTTLVKNLAGLLNPSSGKACLGGMDMNSLPLGERAKRIAYVPQETHIPFPFTALEVVLMGRSPHMKALAFEGREDLSIAHQAMVDTGTAEFSERLIQELSGGEKQRIVLARALAQRSEVMLLDEPSTALDIRHRVRFYRLVGEKCRTEGLTVVATMHDLNIAALYCNRVVLLDGGCVASSGTPAEVFGSDDLHKAFNMTLCVETHEKTGLPFVLPLA